MIGVQKRIAALSVCELRVHTKASADRVGSSHRPRKSNVHGLRKLFALHGPNVNVAVQPRPANAIGFDYDRVVGLFWPTHVASPHAQLISAPPCYSTGICAVGRR